MIFDATHLNPDLFSIGNFAIRWYSLAYIIGFVLAWKLCVYLVRKSKNRPNEKDLDDLLTWIIIGVILGGRIGYCLFYNFGYYISNPLHILKIWEGGMSFHGGAIGAIVATYLFTRKNKIPFLHTTDLIAVSAPIGLFLGRIANFINNELWGKTTDGSWGVIFSDGTGLPRHPSQLYEASLEGILMFILLTLIYKSKNYIHGFVSGCFCIFYGIFRIGIEFFREPDSQIGYIVNYFTLGQILSLPMIILGIYLITKHKK